MSKELFIKLIKAIQDHEKEQEALDALIRKITDGFPVATIGHDLITVIIDTINEVFQIKDKDLIEWWLWEDVEKVIYSGDEVISVWTVDELYEYITTAYK